MPAAKQAEAVPSWCSLVREAAAIAVPAAAANAFEYVPVITGLGMVGHWAAARGTNGMEVAVLARAWYNVTAMAPLYGFITPMRTLCPQVRPLSHVSRFSTLSCPSLPALLALPPSRPSLLALALCRRLRRRCLHLFPG